MIIRRPSVFLYVNNPNEKVLKEICAGIEEEGVFFEVFERITTNLDELTYEAARDSMLGAGIGICNTLVALQMRGMPKEKMIESYSMPNVEQCRKLGTNSARVIKKMSLK